jgi:hypothetical protein
MTEREVQRRRNGSYGMVAVVSRKGRHSCPGDQEKGGSEAAEEAKPIR